MVSAVTLSPLFSLPFGQGLEMCGPLRHIPQAVGTVATEKQTVISDVKNLETFQYRKR